MGVAGNSLVQCCICCYRLSSLNVAMTLPITRMVMVLSTMRCHFILLSIDPFWFNSLPVSSGSMTINSDSSVQILAEEGFPLDQLDLQVGVVRRVRHITY